MTLAFHFGEPEHGLQGMFVLDRVLLAWLTGSSNVGIPLVPQSADAELNAMLAEVDPNRIQSIIQTLTNFGTRHTLSVDISNATYGIAPARDWIAAQMRELAAPSNGRIVVTTPSYIQPPVDRVPSQSTSPFPVNLLMLLLGIPFPVNITDVVATIKGSGDSNRTYVGEVLAIIKFMRC